ncbi:MAG: hypothetical protein NVSMB18_27350 [Acetobacteraceae bacterium]
MLPIAVCIGSAFVTVAITLTPQADAPVAAVFPPWWEGTRAFEAAATAGSIVRFGALRFIVVVAPEAGPIAPQLRRAGAWLILDPQALGGCLS